MDGLVSVIVPVYNVEAYLPPCVESILAQTWRNFELTLVDDGSTDGCGVLCDGYAAADARVRVIHQANGGQATARNVALDQCRGQWVAFVDSDDRLEPDYLAVLVNDLTATGADIAACRWQEFGEADAPPVPAPAAGSPRVMDREQALAALFYQRELDAAVWGKLYRSALFEGLRFPDGRIYEDLVLSYQLIDRAERVCWRPYEGYAYRLRGNGTMQETFSERKIFLLDAADELLRWTRERHPALVRAAQSRLVRAYLHLLLQLPVEPRWRPVRRRIARTVAGCRLAVLTDGQAKTGTRAALALSFLGMGALRLLRGASRLGKR